MVLTNKHIDKHNDQTTANHAKILSTHICDPKRFLQILRLTVLSSAAEASVVGSEVERKSMLMADFYWTPAGDYIEERA